MATTAELLNQLQEDKTSIISSLQEIGVDIANTAKFTEIKTIIPNLSIGGGAVVEPPSKDIDLYDYDGTRLYSYSYNDFMNLTELPNNPTHEGLTAEGWNWSLENAKTYISKYKKLDIGQLYTTTSGYTEIIVDIDEDRNTPYMSLWVKGTVNINWGDNTTETVCTGTSTSTEYSNTHTYANGGRYKILLKPENGTTYKLGGASNSGSRLFWANVTNINSKNKAYQNCIKEIYIGSGCSFNNYAFHGLRDLEKLTIRNGATSFGQYMFNETLKLKCIILPHNLKTIPGYFCTNCYSIEHICIGDGLEDVTSPFLNALHGLKRLCLSSTDFKLRTSTITYGYNLKEIYVPASVTTIDANAIAYSYGLKYLFFTNHTSIPTVSTSSFSSYSDDLSIVVPDDLYNSWIATTGWTTYASKIIKESDL